MGHPELLTDDLYCCKFCTDRNYRLDWAQSNRLIRTSEIEVLILYEDLIR
jgi:hypothetical protein